MARRAAVLVVVLLLASLATVDVQTVPAAPAAPGAPTATPTVATPAPAAPVTTPPTSSATATPGNPSNPGDFTNNPYPTMPWFGVATPYGQFVRWLWMPPLFANADGRVIQQPGYWVAETTSGYYYVDHWELAQGPTGELTWRMVPRAFQPR